jgi:hypothetical protein
MPRADDLPSSLRPLAHRHAATIEHSSFKHDAERLANALAKIVPSNKPIFHQNSTPTVPGAMPNRRWSGCKSWSLQGLCGFALPAQDHEVVGVGHDVRIQRQWRK